MSLAAIAAAGSEKHKHRFSLMLKPARTAASPTSAATAPSAPRADSARGAEHSALRSFCAIRNVFSASDSALAASLSGLLQRPHGIPVYKRAKASSNVRVADVLSLSSIVAVRSFVIDAGLYMQP